MMSRRQTKRLRAAGEFRKRTQAASHVAPNGADMKSAKAVRADTEQRDDGRSVIRQHPAPGVHRTDVESVSAPRVKPTDDTRWIQFTFTVSAG